MEKQDEGDFVAKKVSYMIQAIQGALSKDVIKGFGKSKSDSERFSSAWNLKEVHEVIVLEKEFEEKSAKLAKIHREKGNEYFQKKSYLTALGEYTMSVLKAPHHLSSSQEQADSDGKNITSSEEKPSVAETPSPDKAEKCLIEDAPDCQKENKGLEESEGRKESKDHEEKKSDEESKGQEESKVQEESGGTDNECKTPSDDEKPKNELALAFANRSAALFHLKKYTECLDDIQFAIESGYPEESRHKLYDRQGSCYIELGNPAEAESSFDLARNSLAAANLDEKTHKSWLRTLAKQLSRCKDPAAKPELESAKNKRPVVPQITGEPGTTHPDVSAKVRILYNNVVGRHLVAGQDIKIGDALVVDRPFASVLFPRFHKTHCYHCFTRVSVPVPCEQCSSLVFCSRQCRDASWTNFHRYECPFFALLDTSMCAKIGHLAVRLVMVLGLNRALDLLRKREGQSALPSPESVGMGSDGIYRSDYDSIYDMVTHGDRRSSEQLFDFSVVSCLLMKILQMSGFVEIAEDSHDFALLGGLLLRHLQIVQCNAMRVIELQQPGRFDDLKPGELGIGLYPTAALVNHSCDPSADLNFYSDSVVVRAIRNIQQDEEVAVSYGPLFYESKTGLRQAQLKGAYFFHCRCQACKEQWPVVEEMFDESPSYRCGNCRANLRTEDKFERKFYKCAKCQYKQDMEDVVSQLQTSYDVFARAMNDAMIGRSQDALPNFVQHLLLLQRYIKQPWRDFCACQSAIKQCYRLQANAKP